MVFIIRQSQNKDTIAIHLKLNETLAIKKIIMRNVPYFQYMVVFFLLFTVSSCEVIGGIFKAGVWTGIFVVVAIIVLVIFIISRASGKK